MIAAFDIATASGVAFGGPNDGSPRLLTWRLPGCGPEHLDRSLSGLHASVSELLRLIKATHVYIEAPLQMGDRSSHTALALVSLVAVARAAAHRHGAKISLVHVAKVRKHFANQGRPENPKRAVTDRCNLLGWTPADDNQADAAALWAYGMAVVFPRWSPRSTPLFSSRSAA